MKLTDKERKAIVAEYTNGEATHRSLAAKYGVAPNTIKNVIKENADFAQKCADIKKENAESMMEYLKGRLPIARDIVDKSLKRLLEQINKASTYEVTGLFKTVTEVFIKAAGNNPGSDNNVTLNVHFKDLSAGEKKHFLQIREMLKIFFAVSII